MQILQTVQFSYSLTITQFGIISAVLLGSAMCTANLGTCRVYIDNPKLKTAVIVLIIFHGLMLYAGQSCI